MAVKTIELTIPEHFNPDAHAPEEHLMNLKFQLSQVDFWLSKTGELEHARGNAKAKSRCLLEAAEKLAAALGREVERGQ